MKSAILFSGGKDSMYAMYLAEKNGHDVKCLISIFSRNKDSYMFHTPSIKQVKQQAKVMGLPLIKKRTSGEKEFELADLQKAIEKAKKKYGIDTIVTGALHSKYQESRIQRICNKLGLNCFNPLWQKDEIEYLNDLLKNKFSVIIVGVSAYPLDKSWLGRKIDKKFIEDVKGLKEKYQIHPAGEGGEFETFVLDCPLFEKPLKVKKTKVTGKDYSWTMEIEVE